MYLIITYKNQDIAKVWQEGKEIKFDVFDPEFQKDVEKAINSGLELIHTWDREATKKEMKKADPLISRLGYAFGWHIVKIRDEDIDVDYVDGKTNQRWSTRLPIIKDEKSQVPSRVK
jgi:hypothetical protein